MANPQEKQKAILYVRVSTKEQVEDGNSLATQERLCRDYAIRNELVVISEGVFIEQGESAKTVDRTELQKLLKFAMLHREEVGSLIVYKIDRLSREVRDYADLKAYFDSLGIKILSTSESFDNTPFGRWIEHGLANNAQFENETRAERCKGGMIESVRNGRWVWKAPLGFINTRVDGKKNIKPDDQNNTQTLLREAWELVDSGYTIESAHKMLKAKGLANAKGKPISLRSFYNLFRNPIYKAVIEAFGLTIASQSILPIIDSELFDRVLDKLTGRQTVPSKYQKTNPLYPLRGILYCAKGHRMTASSPRGNGGRYPKYHCSRCRGIGTSHDKKLVEERFVELLNEVAYHPTMTEALVVAIEENWLLEQRGNASEIAKQRRRLIALDEDDIAIGLKNRSGVYQDDFTKKLLATNNLERTQIKLELGRQTYPEQEVEKVIEFGASSLQHISTIWSDLDDLHVKQRFQKWLFPVGLQWNGENFGTIENIELNLSLSLKKQLLSKNCTLVIPRGVEPRFAG